MPMPLSGLAQTLSNSVTRVQAEIVDTQNQLSAGVKTLNPGQAGVVTRLSAQATGYDQTLTNIGTAQSVIAVAQSSLTSIASILTQMQALANQASSASLSSKDRDSLNATFTNLASQVTSLGTSSSVNGSNLLSGTSGITVTTGIAGNAGSSTSVTGVDIPTLATTVGNLLINSSFTTPTDTKALNTPQVDTVSSTTGATTMASNQTLVVGGLTFTANAATVTQTQAFAAIAAYINGTAATSSYGTFSGSSQAAMQAIYKSATAGTQSIALTWASPGAQTATTASSSGTFTGLTATAAITAAVNQTDTIALGSGSIAANTSFSIGGITYTTGSSAVATSTVATDFAAYITSNTPATNGASFSGARTLLSNSWTAAPSGTSIVLTSTAVGTVSGPAIVDAGTINAAAAVASLTTQLQTVSTGQSTLAASATGLTAQASANTALKTGLTNTVNSIQNIDATAMQAKLQQLNNQQSIDYYLVSQMNTEAAAILSIFR
ncbi:hypothetical protein [Polynucleobacter campilacus]|uniref:Flagellin N-terminal domain-containing protein n=1 Tax=Polynucleobacter campilacus TaxID=1743163 RepID=A0A254PRF7_9BURK|nr:hypothetical protein [Polynucleobacter campilacus]OWS69143.1 hypothetical protein CBI31_08705 [Polynucleobacter campilacus]